MRSYYAKLLELIEYRHTSDEAIMFKGFIKLMGEDAFNVMFEGYFLNGEEFDTNFTMFHKSMRQTDFYTFNDFSHNAELDMLFWNYLHVSEVPYKLLLKLFKYDWSFFDE